MANSRTHQTFAKDAVRLYGARNGSDQQKALAIYYHALRVLGHGGDYVQGPPGKEEAVWDAWMIAHVYPKALREWWGWFLIDLWKAQHDNWSFDPKTAVARKVSLQAPSEKPPVEGAGDHVEAALRWTDADGVSRWHLFDGNMGYFAYARGTDRVATPEEIRAEFPALLTRPHNPPHPFFVLSTKHGNAESDPAFRKFLGNTYPFSYSGARRLTRYSTDFDLRKGESLRRQWHDDGKPVVGKRFKDVAIPASIDGADRSRVLAGRGQDLDPDPDGKRGQKGPRALHDRSGQGPLGPGAAVDLQHAGPRLAVLRRLGSREAEGGALHRLPVPGAGADPRRGRRHAGRAGSRTRISATSACCRPCSRGRTRSRWKARP